MKRLLLLAVLIVTVLAAVTMMAAGCEKTDEMLYVMNWYEYIDEDLLGEFEEYYYEKTGKTISVVYITQDTNEIMITQTINADSAASGGKMNLDLVCPSEYAIQKLLTLDLIQPLGEKKEELWNGIQPLFTTEIQKTFSDLEINGQRVDLTDYFVPYMMGTLGIMYNTDKVTEKDLEEGWGLLWNSGNNPELKGKIYMKDSIRDAYVAAVMRLKETGELPVGYENMTAQQLINNSDDQLIAAVEEVLKAQKEQVMGYSVDFDKDEMKAGRAYVDLAWSGDAAYTIEEAAEEGVNLDYFVPESGSNIWFDGWVVTKKAQNPEAAIMFVEYLNQPVNAVRNMMAIGYSSAVEPEILRADEEAMEVLAENEYDEEEFFSNQVMYYTGTADLGVMKDFGNKESSLVNMWERVKAQDNDPTVLIFIIVIVVVAVLVAVALIIVFKNKKSTRRKVN